MRIGASPQVSTSRGFGMQVRNLCSHSRSESGLSRFDVVVILGTVAMLALHALVILPYLARPKSHHGPTLRCVNNLKQIGLAYRMFANDNSDKFPWQISTNAGGSMEYAASPEVFRHFQSASNELNTPKILHCRADVRRLPATDWTIFGNINVSYFVGLDASEAEPGGILSGDREIIGGIQGGESLRVISKSSRANWPTNMHEGYGCLAFADGSVQRTDSAGLQLIIKSNTLPLLRLAIP